MKPTDWLTIFKLKELPRAGWQRVGISSPESVASHSWGLALLCLEWGPKVSPQLDMNKILTMALVHDLPEVVVGDITPHDGISKVEKHRREHLAAIEILPKEWLTVWTEYQLNESEESKFVHQMDKIDMVIQAVQYKGQADTSEFIESANSVLGSKYQQILSVIIQSL